MNECLYASVRKKSINTTLKKILEILEKRECNDLEAISEISEVSCSFEIEMFMENVIHNTKPLEFSVENQIKNMVIRSFPETDTAKLNKFRQHQVLQDKKCSQKSLRLVK